MSILKCNYIERYFGQGETIEAVIRNCNKNETISGGLLKLLTNEFNRVNDDEVPKLGKIYKIPIINNK